MKLEILAIITLIIIIGLSSISEESKKEKAQDRLKSIELRLEKLENQ